MSDFIHRTIMSISYSASDSLHTEPTWKLLTRAEADAASLIEQKYRKFDGSGNVVEMTQAEKDAVDAAALIVRRDQVADSVDNLENILRAFILALLDERNRMAAAFNDLKNGIANANNLASVKAVAAAISDEPIRTVGHIKTGIRNKLGT